MPRLPRPRGFDIRDTADDCYDATGKFTQLAAPAAHEPAGQSTAKAEESPSARVDHELPELPDVAAGRGRGASRWWATAAVALTALLAAVIALRDGDREPARTAPTPAPAVVRPAPAPAVAAPASAAPRKSARRARSKPTRPRKQPRQRPVRSRPAPPVAVPVPRAVRPPAAPVRRPVPRPVPAGEEFILGAP